MSNPARHEIHRFIHFISTTAWFSISNTDTSMSHWLCFVQLHSERGIKYAKYLTLIYIRLPCRKETSYILTHGPLMSHSSQFAILCEVLCSVETIFKVATLFEPTRVQFSCWLNMHKCNKHVQCLHLDKPTYWLNCLDNFPDNFFFMLYVSDVMM